MKTTNLSPISPDPKGLCEEALSGPSSQSRYDGREGVPHEVRVPERENRLPGAVDMQMTEDKCNRLLHIRTTGRGDSPSASVQFSL